MGTLGAYLKLFRWANLLIMAAAQVLFRYAIIIPAFASRGLHPVLTHLDFSLLVLSTMMISAAAYAINDYFDLRIDRINKPDRIILGKSLSRRKAILSHSLLTFLGVAIGFYLSWKVNYWPLAIVFLIIPALLWLYSIRYKRKFLVGNLVVAFLSAFVVAIVWVVEYRSMAGVEQIDAMMQHVGLYARIFTFFAFFTTLIREIIKDVEDVRGDAKAGCKTIPVVMGVAGTRRVVLVLMVLLLLSVGYAQWVLFRQDYYLLPGYLLLFVQIPLLGLLIQGIKASSQKDFRRMQYLVKFIMLTGICSMLLVSIYL